MAGTQEEIDDQRDLVAQYRASIQAALGNQSYKMPDGRELVRAPLKDLQAGYKMAQDDLARLTGTGIGRARRGVARIC